MNPGERIEAILAYHKRTKHHLHRFAASAGYLNWETQPDPFRTFNGAETIALPLAAEQLETPYRELSIPGSVLPSPLDLHSLSILLELSLGLSAWKQYRETRWALRCNPSSGNLHPTEGYVVLPEIPGIPAAGVYHYAAREHRLERRTSLQQSDSAQMSRILPAQSLVVGLSSIHWREAWKYGERAYRYCQHDLGHALAALRYSAAALGWSARLLEDVSDPELAEALGLAGQTGFQEIDRHDREWPGALLLVGPDLTTGVDIDQLLALLRGGCWSGEANALSSSHVEWDAIDEAAAATWKDERISVQQQPAPALPVLDSSASQLRASQIFRQRRSAVAFDGKTAMAAPDFYAMMDHLAPRPTIPPWDAWARRPRIHCAIFVHRVETLEPGLYLLERNDTVHDALQTAMDPGFVFAHPSGCPRHLRFYKLAAGDFRQDAEVISCRQKIASNGAFSLGMLAEFENSIRTAGAAEYRRLFWECGMLGHVLYLEAEARGIRGTGIGCYFDDAFHTMLGLTGNQFQSLYHFTVGGPVEDTRLMTLPGYTHADRQ